MKRLSLTAVFLGLVQLCFAQCTDDFPPYFQDGNPENLELSCSDDIPPAAIVIDDNSNAPLFSYSEAVEELNCAETVLTRTYVLEDECGESTTVVQTITVLDNEAPNFTSTPLDITVECGDPIPDPETLQATDNCDNSVEITVEESGFGTGQACEITSAVDDNDIEQAFVLFDFLDENHYFTAENMTMFLNDDLLPANATISGDLISNENPNAGFHLELNLSNGLDWETWTSQDFPTSYKDDQDLAGDNYLDWLYFIIDSSSSLTGFGDLEGSFLQLHHTPANYYYGYQMGEAANNLDAALGGGGWVTMEGVYIDSSNGIMENINGLAGDFFFHQSCCGSPGLSYTYTATDCAGNSTSITQVIEVSDTEGPVLSNYPEDLEIQCGQSVPAPEMLTANDACTGSTEVFLETSYPQGEPMECSNYLVVYTYTSEDCAGHVTIYSQTITVGDTEDPVLSAYPEDLELGCVEDVPDPIVITAVDNCEGEIDVDLNINYPLGSPSCELNSVMLPGGELAFSFTGILGLEETPFVTQSMNWNLDDSQTPAVATISGTIVNSASPDDGFQVEIELADGLDWEAWSNQDFPTDYLDDENIVEDEYLDWMYFILQSGSSLTGFGNYDGSDLALEHAPPSLFYAWQYGVKANGVNANNGLGGWAFATGNLAIVDEGINEEVGGGLTVKFDTGSCCSDFIVEYTYSSEDCTGNSVSHTQTISVTNDTPPVLSDTPEDLLLICGAETPEPAEITAKDDCEGDIPVTLSISYIDEGNGCVLTDATSPSLGNPQRSAWIQDVPGLGDLYFTASNATLTLNEEIPATAFITATLTLETNSSAGFFLELDLANGLNWELWSTQDFPTSYKDDYNLAGDNYLDWLYFIIQSGSSHLTGFGDYEGSFLLLNHAPTSHFYGYQMGQTANNLDDSYGNGGWFYTEGTFIDSANDVEIENLVTGGDFFFEQDCCTQPDVLYTWTASDCFGNIATHTQQISFADSAAIDPPSINEPVVGVHGWHFKAMPNPTQDLINLILLNNRGATTTKCFVSDAMGNRVSPIINMSMPSGASSHSLDLTGLKPGIYWVVINSQIGREVQKVVKM